MRAAQNKNIKKDDCLLWAFEPDLDGPHKRRLLHGLVPEFDNFLERGARTEHMKGAWTTFKSIYEIIHKVCLLLFLY